MVVLNTAVVCKDLNRDFIGFEVNEVYVNMINKGLEELDDLKKKGGNE